MNDVTLNKSKISKYLGERVKAHKDRHYSIEEIEKLLHFCDDRLKAIVLLLASTGVRLGVLSQLRLSNLVVQQQYDLYQITIYENTKDEYIVFTTPEAKRAIDDYLQYRERCGEKLTPKSPLFRQQFDRTDSFGVTHPKALTDLGIITILDNALIKSGIKTIIRQTENSVYRSKLRQDVSMFNGFRKLVATNFVKAKINLVIKEMLLGHTTGLDENYYRPAENELLEEYLKVVNFLTINEENRLKIKVEELTSKTKDNEYVINHKLREKDEQLQTMEKQMQAMQNTQDELKLLLKNPRRLVEILDKEAK